MLATFQSHINTHFSFLKNKKLLVTVSGGIDSVVLVCLLRQLKFDISIAHCNFNLRGADSDLDEQFVKELASDLNLTAHIISFETEVYAKKNKLSIQMAARELRYDWFEEIRQKNKLDYILTAHHKDDVLETFLINLSRGTGLEGLTGIPSQNGFIVRPMLSISRDEIKSFAKENIIEWREDKSNASTKYLRNKIRHDLVPLLKELNPSFMDSFENTINHLNGSQQIVNDAVQEIEKRVVSKKKDYLELDIEELQKLSDPKIYLYQLLVGYGFSEWDDVHKLLAAQSGKQVFSKTHRLIKDRKKLLLAKKLGEKKSTEIEINHFQDNVDVEGVQLIFTKNEESDSNSNFTVSVNFDKLVFPLKLRKWEQGDYFYPLGLNRRKKLSDFFKDEKMSLIDKERIWLLCNRDNEIIWVVGRRLDHRYRISSKTKEFIKITFMSASTGSA